jgi:hypothetical protein
MAGACTLVGIDTTGPAIYIVYKLLSVTSLPKRRLKSLPKDGAGEKMESEKWYLIGALWGDPCFGCYNQTYTIGVYGEREFCEVFTEKLERLYGLRTYIFQSKAGLP